MRGDPTLSPPRSPFHYGLFYNAMRGLMGRDPSDQFRMGYDGIYVFKYYPEDFTSLTKDEDFYKFAFELGQWLDKFDIIFSASECRYGIHMNDENRGKYLLIRITHPVERESER